MFESKKCRGICVIALKNDAKFDEELTCALKNDMENLVNFTETLKNHQVCRVFFVQGI